MAMVLGEEDLRKRYSWQGQYRGCHTLISYSQWESCGLQQGSKTSAPGSASAGGGWTAPSEALAQGSLRVTKGGFSRKVDYLASSTTIHMPPPPTQYPAIGGSIGMVGQKIGTLCT